MLVAMGGIFIFWVFIPMQRQKKQQAQMLASLEAGSEGPHHRRDRGNHRQHHRRHAHRACEALTILSCKSPGSAVASLVKTETAAPKS